MPHRSMSYLARSKHTDINLFFFPIFNPAPVEQTVPTSAVGAWQPPVLRGRSRAGPRAMVTKSSNPTAGSSERSTETQGEKESCLGEQLQG